MTYRKHIVLFFVCIFFTCSCGGRTANPVSVKRDQDPELTCTQIEYEIYQIRNDITELYSQAAKSRKKICLMGVGNLISCLFQKGQNSLRCRSLCILFQSTKETYPPRTPFFWLSLLCDCVFFAVHLSQFSLLFANH